MVDIMSTASFDRPVAGMWTSISPQPVVMARAGLSGELAIPEDANTMALIVHPAADGRGHPGHRFVADVLRANGVATLSIGLRTAEEEARRAPLAGGTELVPRLQAALQWLDSHAATCRLPLALIGVNDAAASCAQAARLPGFEAIRSVVLLDGWVDLRDSEVAAWRQPTLCIAGRHGITRSGQPLAGARSLPRPHRLVKLPMQTQPRVCSGAFQAMACEVTAWLRKQPPAPRERMSQAMKDLASAQ